MKMNILITDQFKLDISSIEMAKMDWISVNRGSSTYEDLGDVERQRMFNS